MKKIISIIVFLQCAIVAFAVTYATPYKGAGRNGYVYSSARTQTCSAYSGIAQVPTASMHSTASMQGRGIAFANTNNSAMSQVRVMQTSASFVVGGITANETYAHISKPRKAPSNPDRCPCIDEDEDNHCDHCGAEMDEFDGGCFNNPCWCPIGDGWQVWLFMAVLAIVYAYIKKTTGKVLADK